MNKYFLLALLTMTSITISAKQTMADVTPESLNQARVLVNAYMTAMMQGDTNTIKDLLGGTFLQKKRAMLESPDYSSVLTDIYASASYEITGVSGANNNQVVVDVKLAISQSNIMDTRFIISRISDSSTLQVKYLITDEKN